MKLRKLLAGVPLTEENFDGDMEITSLSYDSRTLEPGALFVALPGAKTDGSRFIDQAMERGAAAVLAAAKAPRPLADHPRRPAGPGVGLGQLV